ncbi:MAG: glycoside hydrolase family 92 protein, partial [Bacteroidota bacterium]|nr:glycoside hydrolase family 92 protein [Bacteroidota bacterium]
LYPANAVSGRYELGSPRFTKTEIKLANGKVFRIMAPGVSKTNIYIQSAMLNGKPLTRTFITHKELLAGGELKLVMGAKPVK